ncbi:MAG: hypothetical protein V1903_09325 [Bacteroidota bacterium]
MKKNIIAFTLLFLTGLTLFPQRVNIYQSGISSQQNLNAISGLPPFLTISSP